MRKRTYNLRKPINILRFFKFEKSEMDQKYEEMNLKFEETDQQNEIFKVFEKTETDQKYEEADLKFEETVSVLRRFHVTHLTVLY